MSEVEMVPIVGPEQDPRRSVMQEPEDVAVMLRLSEQGMGTRAIARELGVSRNTVRSYLKQGGWRPYKRPSRRKALDGLDEWLRERFLQHKGNAEVVRQELVTAKGVEVSLRTVERAVAPYRRELRAQRLATTRFETAPGHQLQADFGQITVAVAGRKEKVHLCVLTLGYSRRIFVKAFQHERQSAWLSAFEAAFLHFGGVPKELLLDNARALVKSHNRATREVVFNDRLTAFCSHWGIRPRACAPYRARTKGKDERSVGYVKRNAIAGRSFESWDELEAHLERWMREIADQRVHGTTGERPAARFERDEADALAPLASRPPYERERELRRKVANDLCVDVDTNRYSVPWRLIGEVLSVRVTKERVRIFYASECVADHRRSQGRKELITDPAHYEGITAKLDDDRGVESAKSSFVSNLAAYEAVIAEGL